MNTGKPRLSLSTTDIRILLTLVKDRQRKIQLGNLNYSQYYLDQEKNNLDPLVEKLESMDIYIKSKGVLQ